MTSIRTMEPLPTISAIVTAYLLGSIPFGLLIARLGGIRDVRRYGSGNIGATNVVRAVGLKYGIWVYVADIGKGVLPVLIGRYVVAQYDVVWVSDDVFLVLCALCAILGHVFPLFLNFRGGKGVNTMLGAMITILPLECLVALGVFAVVFAIFRIISLASILATCSLFFILLVEETIWGQPVAEVYYVLAVGLAVLVLSTHRENIRRILAGTESRFNFRSGSQER